LSPAFISLWKIPSGCQEGRPSISWPAISRRIWYFSFDEELSRTLSKNVRDISGRLEARSRRQVCEEGNEKLSDSEDFGSGGTGKARGMGYRRVMKGMGMVKGTREVGIWGRREMEEFLKR
jgi:hypothetical protein